MPASYTSPYWNPGQYLGPGGYDYGTTDIGRFALEQQPDVAYYRYGRTIGVPDDQTAFARWFAQQYPQFLRGYGAYTVSNPFDATITGYTDTLGGYDAWYRRFLQSAPQIRGLDPGSRGGGPARWVSWT